MSVITVGQICLRYRESVALFAQNLIYAWNVLQTQRLPMLVLLNQTGQETESNTTTHTDIEYVIAHDFSCFQA